MSRPRVSRRTIVTHAATAVVSAILVGVAGTTYLDVRINRAFEGLCGILVVNTEPYPQPPQSPDVPPPTSEYGMALAKYNDEIAERQRQGLAALNSAVVKYNCRD